MSKVSRAKWIPFILLASFLAGCPAVLVSSITITPGVPSDGSTFVAGAWEPNNSIATLQLTANVSPSNASKRSVTWSTNHISGETGQMSVSANGLITVNDSSGNFVETVTAMANDGSGVTATFTVNAVNYG